MDAHGCYRMLQDAAATAHVILRLCNHDGSVAGKSHNCVQQNHDAKKHIEPRGASEVSWA